MTKILFVIPSFDVGGTVVSTLNLISLLDKKIYDIYVLPMSTTGSLRDLYKPYKILDTNIFLEAVSMMSWKLEKNPIRRFLIGIIRKVTKRSDVMLSKVLHMGIRKCLSRYHFDTAAACQEGMSTLCVSKMPIKNKVSWVRCDYARHVNEQNKTLEQEMYSHFNSIICVSDYTMKTFKDVFPEFSSRVSCINNPQNTQYILDRGILSETEPRFNNDCFTLLSIGRFDPIKRFDAIPRIAREIKDKGIEFKWYVVGSDSGTEADKVRNAIEQEGVSENVFLLGIKTNPHYYIKHSDLLVCVSKSEACPRVINEAKILGTPTICTDFPTSAEFIENGVDGIISPLENVPENIIKIIEDKVRYNDIREKIKKFRFDNDGIMKSLDGILR